MAITRGPHLAPHTSGLSSTRMTYDPKRDVGKQAYTSTLQRWLERQHRATRLYAGAEEPLQETVGMFRPGGGYGAGQIALIEDEAKRAQAEALAEQVRTGMSSGSLATSTRLRGAADVTKAKLGVEDVRTQFLSQALSQLSGLRGAQAGQVGATVDPTYAPYMGYRATTAGISGGLQQTILRINEQRRQAEALAARPKPVQPKTDEPPWASLSF